MTDKILFYGIVEEGIDELLGYMDYDEPAQYTSKNPEELETFMSNSIEQLRQQHIKSVDFWEDWNIRHADLDPLFPIDKTFTPPVYKVVAIVEVEQ